jgi:hypothetical protein
MMMEQCLINAKRAKDAAVIRKYYEDHQAVVEPALSR